MVTKKNNKNVKGEGKSKTAPELEKETQREEEEEEEPTPEEQREEVLSQARLTFRIVSGLIFIVASIVTITWPYYMVMAYGGWGCLSVSMYGFYMLLKSGRFHLRFWRKQKLEYTSNVSYLDHVFREPTNLFDKRLGFLVGLIFFSATSSLYASWIQPETWLIAMGALFTLVGGVYLTGRRRVNRIFDEYPEVDEVRNTDVATGIMQDDYPAIAVDGQFTERPLALDTIKTQYNENMALLKDRKDIPNLPHVLERVARAYSEFFHEEVKYCPYCGTNTNHTALCSKCGKYIANYEQPGLHVFEREGAFGVKHLLVLKGANVNSIIPRRKAARYRVTFGKKALSPRYMNTVTMFPIDDVELDEETNEWHPVQTKVFYCRDTPYGVEQWNPLLDTETILAKNLAQESNLKLTRELAAVRMSLREANSQLDNVDERLFTVLYPQMRALFFRPSSIQLPSPTPGQTQATTPPQQVSNNIPAKSTFSKLKYFLIGLIPTLAVIVLLFIGGVIKI